LENDRKFEDERWMLHAKVHEVAEKNVDRRLHEMNEFRAQINTERGQYVTRTNYDLQHETLRTAIDDLRKTVWMATGGVLVISFVVTLLIHFGGK